MGGYHNKTIAGVVAAIKALPPGPPGTHRGNIDLAVARNITGMGPRTKPERLVRELEGILAKRGASDMVEVPYRGVNITGAQPQPTHVKAPPGIDPVLYNRVEHAAANGYSVVLDPADCKRLMKAIK